jgi:hypothetical protein
MKDRRKGQDMIPLYLKEQTTSQYWDCDCEKDYIHPKYHAVCAQCGLALNIDNPPDSLVGEVLEAGFNIVIKKEDLA